MKGAEGLRRCLLNGRFCKEAHDTNIIIFQDILKRKVFLGSNLQHKGLGLGIDELSNCRIVELSNCRIVELSNWRFQELTN